MADVAQLVRASVCGTECRRFESGHPPHKKLNTPMAWFIFYLVIWAGRMRTEVRRDSRFCKRSAAKPLRAEGAPSRHRQMGICNPVIRPMNSKMPVWAFFFSLALGTQNLVFFMCNEKRPVRFSKHRPAIYPRGGAGFGGAV